MTGVVRFAGKIQPVASDHPAFRNNVYTRSWNWNGEDIRFTVNPPRTLDTGDNTSIGELGITHLGELSAVGTSGLLRWHTNGLQLVPGEPVDVTMMRSRFVPNSATDPYGVWVWERVQGAAARVMLPRNTMIIPITMVQLVYPDRHPLDEASFRDLARMWFDGWTVDRVQRASTNGGNLNLFVADHDPRPRWTTANFNDPRAGAFGEDLQDIDGVWSQCGAKYDLGIQFKLERVVARVDVAQVPRCNPLPGGQGLSLAPCMNSLYSLLYPELPGDPPIPQHYLLVTVATNQTANWTGAALQGMGALLRSPSMLFNPNIAAHELGHVIGIPAIVDTADAGLFDDGPIPGNLMNQSGVTGGSELLRAQCRIVHDFRDYQRFLR